MVQYILEPLMDDKYRAITDDQDGRMELIGRSRAGSQVSPVPLGQVA